MSIARTSPKIPGLAREGIAAVPGANQGRRSSGDTSAAENGSRALVRFGSDCANSRSPGMARGSLEVQRSSEFHSPPLPGSQGRIPSSNRTSSSRSGTQVRGLRLQASPSRASAITAHNCPHKKRGRMLGSSALEGYLAPPVVSRSQGCPSLAPVTHRNQTAYGHG